MNIGAVAGMHLVVKAFPADIVVIQEGLKGEIVMLMGIKVAG